MTVLALVFALTTFTQPMERVSTMDPALSQSVYDSRAIQLVYESPLAIDYFARPYRLVPAACEMPSVSKDGLEYDFRTRHCRAADVVRSLERLRDPAVVSPNGWMLKSVDTIRAGGESNVVIRLKERCHFFPWLMAMTPASVVLADGSGTGEFRLADWRRNHAMTFERKVPKPGCFDRVRYLVVDDMSTKWLMFLSGEVDMLGEVPRDNWDAVIGKDGEILPSVAARGIAFHTFSTLESPYIGINMRDPILGPNRRLRQALNAAFDYPVWNRFASGRTMPADGPVPPGVEGRLDAPFAYAWNLGLAKRLVAEAGYADGVDPKTGRRLVLTMAIGRASEESREAGELIAAFYERIGIKLELQFFTWDAFLKSVNEGRVQLYRMGWVGDYPDAENFLQLFYSKNVSPGPNHTNYANAEFDKAYDGAMAATDAETRNACWRRCQEIIREDCPWVFTHFSKAGVLVHSRVGNFKPGDFPYGQETHFTVKEK